APRAAVRGPRPRGGLRDSARRGAVSLLRADDVSPPGGASRGAGTPEPAPAPALRSPGTPGSPAPRAVELGYHQAPRAGEGDLLLPVRDARCLQPIRGRLDGGASGERHTRRAVHPRDVCQARDRTRSADRPRRSRTGDDLEARGAAPG